MSQFGITGDGPVRGDEAPSELDETVVGSEEAEDDSSPAFPPGTVISRYVVLEQIGAGGMGVVLAAFDPELGRRIALKILRPRRSRRGATARVPAASRLMREAQAIARLAHPNVVSVFDVGRHGDSVFVAMEFVEGVTLTTWLEQEPRTLEAVLEVFAGAGRGLAAAHKAGLVHRDFKPDNVLVGPDDRVRVLDFGLARADLSQVSMSSLDESALPGGPPVRDWSDSDVLSSPLTRDDAVVGTPRFMAPEQHAGLTTNGRSDQFSFFVALYQALYKQDPFPAQSLRKIVALKVEGRIAAPPRSAKVPSWLEEAIQRGLSPRPDQRFGSMDEVVDLLLREREVKRRRWVSAIAGVVLVGGTVWAVGLQQSEAERPCQTSEARMAEVWNDTLRAEVRAAIEGTALPYADHTWSEVQARVDAYAAEWITMHRDACEATRVRAEQSEELHDLRMACLTDARSRLDAIVDILRVADTGVVERATQAVSALPAIAACAELERLTREVAPPSDADVRATVDAIRDTLAQAAALESAGKYADGLAAAQRALATAQTIDYPPVRADALDRLGGLLERTGDYAGAEAHLRDAMWTAIRAGHDARAASAATGLVSVVGDRLARHDEGLLHAEHAAAILDRLAVTGLVRARLDNNAGNVLYRKGELDQARARYERALAVREEISGSDDPAVGLELVNLGNLQLAEGDHDVALATFGRSRSIIMAALGEGHPLVGVAIASMGNVHQALNRPEEAQDHFEEALPVLEEAFGPEHPFVGITVLNIASALHDQHRDEEALAQAERARAIIEAAVGREHPDYADVLEALAAIHDGLERFDRARELWEHALRIRRRAHGEVHVEVASVSAALGDLRRREGEPAQAIDELTAALEMLEQTKADARLVATTRFHLGQARWAALGDLAVARAEVRRAIESLTRVGSRGASDRAEMEAWLRDHPLPAVRRP